MSDFPPDELDDEVEAAEARALASLQAVGDAIGYGPIDLDAVVSDDEPPEDEDPAAQEAAQERFVNSLFPVCVS